VSASGLVSLRPVPSRRIEDDEREYAYTRISTD